MSKNENQELISEILCLTHRIEMLLYLTDADTNEISLNLSKANNYLKNALDLLEVV